MNDRKPKTSTNALVLSALLLAMSIILNLLFDIMPSQVLRIRLGAPILRFIPILFGPFYGGMAFLLNDVINHLIKPMGDFLYPLTIVEVLKGMAMGFLWNRLKDADIKTISRKYLILWSIPLLFSFVSTLFLIIPNQTAYRLLLVSANKNIYLYMILFFILSLSSFIVYFVARKKLSASTQVNLKVFLTLLIVFIIPASIGTTINTVLLNKVYAFGGSSTFIAFFIPRIIKEFIQTLFSAYIVTFLYTLYQKLEKR